MKLLLFVERKKEQCFKYFIINILQAFFTHDGLTHIYICIFRFIIHIYIHIYIHIQQFSLKYVAFELTLLNFTQNPYEIGPSNAS